MGDGKRPDRLTASRDVLRKDTCRDCGRPVLTARAGQGWRPVRRFIMLQPYRVTDGGVTLNRDGQVVPSGSFPGELDLHKCAARISACKYCGERVRVMNQPPGSAERLAVVDADPDPAGIVAIGPDGYARRDPDHELDGDRFRWHAKHGGQPGHGDIARLMSGRPVGRAS